jgi:hypothetical protein
MRGSPALYGMKRHNRKAEPQAVFLKVEPRATRPDSCPLPVTDQSVPHCGRRPIPRCAFLQISRLCSSVANLDAGSIPNAPIAIPNRSASGPVTWRPYVVDGSRRYIDGGWLVVARAARDRCSKQCPNGQATNNAGGYLTTPCNRSPGCKRETKTACDQQTDQKLAHFWAPPNENQCLQGIEAKLSAARPANSRATRCKCLADAHEIDIVDFLPGTDKA